MAVDLKALHFERMKRQPKTYEDKSVGPDEVFSCAVCYTDGSTSGLVTPTCCSHKICLECYTKIVSLKKEKATCPECRTLYIPKAVEAVETVETVETVEAEEDEYQGMPDLIAPSEFDIIYNNHNFNFNINNHNFNMNFNNNDNLINNIISSYPHQAQAYILIQTILNQMDEGHMTS
jgi:hypothetical protein